ncbi:MAG TPA: hypothetical protein VN256_24750 [Pyrinomonadaceae bacterium]|nr:hypothetical protein [Pyrinomonadaceae bacterium]
MIKKLLSVLVAAALVCALGGTSGLAETKPEAEAPETPGKVSKETLRADIFKLVADAKAGSRTVTPPRAQIQTSKGNSLSRGTKIAIGVGIAVAVVVIIAVAVNKRCDNEPGGC